MTDDLELHSGSVLAGYRIERKLGEGGMGAVYLARNPDLPRHDAVKVLSAELSRDSEFRARFVREADVAARLSHPNIVAVYQRGETPAGQLWIAMQFVDGRDSDAALRAGTMTPQRAVDIIGQVATALDYAHGQRVLHRDIKPANFLLAREGDEERALLADFGIARALDEIGLTGGGQVMSTVAYAAPEVLTGTPVDYRADLYSLGCSLFKLLTGNIPFWKAAGAPAVMLAHLQEPPPRVTDLDPGLPPALNEVIATAMAKDPSRRYRTAGELALAASLALRSLDHTAKWRVNITGTADPAGSPLPLPPASPLQPQRAPRKARRRRVVAALVGVGLTAAVVVTGLTVAGRRASHDVDSAPRNAAVQPFPMQKLAGLLPSAADLSAVLGTDITIQGVTVAMGVDSKTIDNQDCAEPWTAAQKTAYFGSGWQAVEYQPAQETHPAPAPLPMVYSFIGVVSFPVARLAQRFVERQKPVWQKCVGQPVTFTGRDHMQFPGQFGDRFSVNDGNVLTMSLKMSDVWFSCGRGLTARNNVVVDVAVCNSADPSAAVATLVKRITDRVPN